MSLFTAPAEKCLYLIGGPMGVGKTAAARQLQALVPANVFLDGDWCWDARPFQVTAETKALVLDNICHLLKNFLLCPAYKNVLFCWVLQQQDIWDELLSRLPLAGVKVCCVHLICSEEALRRRLQGDIDAGRRQPDILEKSARYLPLYARLRSRALDTTGLSPVQVAARIAALAQAERGRPAGGSVPAPEPAEDEPPVGSELLARKKGAQPAAGPATTEKGGYR